MLYHENWIFFLDWYIFKIDIKKIKIDIISYLLQVSKVLCLVFVKKVLWMVNTAQNTTNS